MGVFRKPFVRQRTRQRRWVGLVAAAAGGNRRRRSLITGGIGSMQLLKQSTAASTVVGPILDSAGAEYTGAVIGDMTITKNGTSAAMASAATLTHIANGHYTLAFTTGNTDTLGRLDIHCNKSTYQMPPKSFQVLAAATFDTLVTNGTLASTTSGRTIVTDTAGLVDSNVVKVGPTGSGTAQTARDIGASVLVGDKTGFSLANGSFVTATFGTCDLTATMKASVNTEADTALADYDPPTNAEMEARTLAAASYATAANLATLATYVDTEVAAIKLVTDQLADTLEDAGGGNYRFTVAALANAPGGSGGLDAAGVRAALGMASANMDTQFTAIPTAVAAIDIDGSTFQRVMRGLASVLLVSDSSTDDDTRVYRALDNSKVRVTAAKNAYDKRTVSAIDLT